MASVLGAFGGVPAPPMPEVGWGWELVRARRRRRF